MVKKPRSSAVTSILAAGLLEVSLRSSTWMEAPAGRLLRRSRTWPASKPLPALEVVRVTKVESGPGGALLAPLTAVPGAPAPRGQAGGAGAPGAF